MSVVIKDFQVFLEVHGDGIHLTLDEDHSCGAADFRVAIDARNEDDWEIEEVLAINPGKHFGAIAEPFQSKVSDFFYHMMNDEIREAIIEQIGGKGYERPKSPML
jgi:hypothetical protein